MLQATGSVLVPSFLPEPLRTAAGGGTDAVATGDLPALAAYIRDRLKVDSTDLYGETVRRMEIVLLPMVMAHCNNSQVKASQVLGINRRTLRNKLRELGLLSASKADEADESE